MKLLLLRHGIAHDRATFAATGKEDRLRPLTEEGRKKMRRIGDALAGLLPELALIATSPYARARESAEILARAYPARPVLSEAAELSPAGASAGLLKFLQTQKALPAVACVGHEPDLSQLAGWLLTGSRSRFSSCARGAPACSISPAASRRATPPCSGT